MVIAGDNKLVFMAVLVKAVVLVAVMIMSDLGNYMLGHDICCVVSGAVVNIGDGGSSENDHHY